MRPICIIFWLSVSSAYAEPLESWLKDLSSNIRGGNGSDLIKIEQGIRKQGSELAKNISLVDQAYKVIEAYDRKHKPLFLNDRSKGGFSRKSREGKELEHAILALHQALIDHAYHPDNLKNHPKVIGKAFSTADFFPGKAESPHNSKKTHSVKVDTAQIPPQGSPLTHDDKPAIRCTGWYVSPGTIAEIRVPKSIIGKGYTFRVGAHSWDLVKKPVIKRIDRISLVFPIDEERVFLTNPLGGGIYLEVPARADGEISTLWARNIIRAPFYSARSYDPTSMQDWLKVERKHPAPWTDFESDKFMMQVPTAWSYNYETPDKLIADYDKSMDLVSEITGRPKIRSKVVLYQQIDVITRGSAFFPGYPQSNYGWNPLSKEDGNKKHWFLKGPQFAKSELFHEMGHMERITKFKGEVEAIVNFPYVYVHNQGFGLELDKAFSRSRGTGDRITIDRAAVDRMITDNFRKGRPRNITNRPGDEVKYQHRGYGHYADIAKLFGWEPLIKFAELDHENHRKGKDFPKDINKDPTDNRILRLSKIVGYDLRALFEFWGVYPENESSLAAAIKSNNLSNSPKVHERLLHYKDLIPVTGQDFRDHALIMYPKCKQPGRTLLERNSLFGHGFYHKWLAVYDESHGEAAIEAMNQLIARHFE